VTPKRRQELIDKRAFLTHEVLPKLRERNPDLVEMFEGILDTVEEQLIEEGLQA
jgi:hypothetical protein